MDDVTEEELLVGGHDSGPVLRVGGTVRRTVRPWTSSVHALLRHLEDVGFTGAPRVLGIDEQGREVLTYIAGSDGRLARCYDDDSLARVAEMIRSYHRAVSSFIPAPGSHWRPDPRAPQGQLLCHNDLSPANTIYRDNFPQAFIDWDLATPSTAVWDLSYAVRTFVPLDSPSDCLQMGYTSVCGCSVRPTAWMTRLATTYCPRSEHDCKTSHPHLPIAAAKPCRTSGPLGSARRCGDRARPRPSWGAPFLGASGSEVIGTTFNCRRPGEP